MKRLILIASIMLGGLTISQAYRQTETTHIEKQQEQEWQRGQTITLRPGQSADELAALFAITPIDEATEKRMREGGSYKDECPIPLADLRYLHLVHYDYDGRIVCGEMVCHKIIAQKLIDVFTELFLAHYPIASIRLIDDFGANDEVSMSHNNSSCFCYRAVTGGKTLSRHARGLAVATRNVPGIAEAIRAGSMAITKRAMLSRGVSVLRHSTLIVNLPGSKKAVEEALEMVLPTLEHGIRLAKGTDGECGRT